MIRMFSLAVTFATLASLAVASPGGSLNVARLVDSADIVGIGDGTFKVASDGSTSLSVSIGTVIKGVVGGPLTNTWSGRPVADGTVLHGLWLFTTGGGSSIVMPHRVPLLLPTDAVLVLPGGIAPPASPVPIDSVVDALRSGLAASTDAPTKADILDAMSLVVSPDSPAALEHLRLLGDAHLAECSTAALIRDWGSIVLSAAGDPSAPPQAARYVCNIQDVGRAADLVALLASQPPDTTVGRCALHALATIHTAGSLATLGSFLAHPDPAVRYEALSGIALFANDVMPGGRRVLAAGATVNATVDTAANFPTLDGYLAEPSRYDAFWRTWISCLACRTDTVPPTVAFAEPADGAVVHDTVSIAISAQDNVGVQSVELFVDDNSITTLSAAPYRLDWNARSVPNGVHVLRAVAKDQVGHAAEAHVAVRVDNDVTPPTLSVFASPNTLWPPNNKLVSIRLSVSVSDDRDPAPTVQLVGIACGECAAGDIVGAAIGTDDREVQLRATRNGNGPGRTYVLTYQARDASGNTSRATATVSVPHDQGK